MIKDSGERTQFSTGAVRDMKKGKGRMDLVPLDVIASLTHDVILKSIYNFQQTKDVKYLYKILHKFGTEIYKSIPDMVLDVSKHFEEGAIKYKENNWKAGIPIKSYIDSMSRHYMKILRKDHDENHLRAFIWNVMCCIWTVKHIEGDE